MDVNMDVIENGSLFMGYLSKLTTVRKKWKLRHVILDLSRNVIATWMTNEKNRYNSKEVLLLNKDCIFEQITLSENNYFAFKITTKYSKNDYDYHEAGGNVGCYRDYCSLPGYPISYANPYKNKLKTSLTFRCNSKQALNIWLQLIEDCVLRATFFQKMFSKRIDGTTNKFYLYKFHYRLFGKDSSFYQQMLIVYTKLINFQHNKNNNILIMHCYEFMAYCYAELNDYSECVRCFEFALLRSTNVLKKSQHKSIISQNYVVILTAYFKRKSLLQRIQIVNELIKFDSENINKYVVEFLIMLSEDLALENKYELTERQIIISNMTKMLNILNESIYVSAEYMLIWRSQLCHLRMLVNTVNSDNDIAGYIGNILVCAFVKYGSNERFDKFVPNEIIGICVEYYSIENYFLSKMEYIWGLRIKCVGLKSMTTEEISEFVDLLQELHKYKQHTIFIEELERRAKNIKIAKAVQNPECLLM